MRPLWGWEILAIANVGFWLGVLIFLWRSLPTIPTLADEPFVQTLQGSGLTQASGGHSPIPLRPDDDLQLGKVIKQAGYRQGLAFGQGMVEVAWYHSVGEMARGLEKIASPHLTTALRLSSSRVCSIYSLFFCHTLVCCLHLHLRRAWALLGRCWRCPLLLQATARRLPSGRG